MKEENFKQIDRKEWQVSKGRKYQTDKKEGMANVGMEKVSDR